MKFPIAGIMVCAAVLSLLSGAAGMVFAFQNMACTVSPAAGKSDRTICKTDAADNGMVKMTCESTPIEKGSAATYTCTKTIRDWGKSSSPYAHTSGIWRCENGNSELYIFTADFDQDSIRCDLVCGKCATAWKIGPSGSK